MASFGAVWGGVPFRVVEPQAEETPVVVEVPHAGLGVDPIALSTLVAPARALGADADLHVDELYAEAPEVGATLLVAHMSRLICDLNRPESELDHRVATRGTLRNAPHGVIWAMTTEGYPTVGRPLPPEEVERRLDTIHRPYHRCLHQLLERKRARFGFAILISGHSMPSSGRDGVPRADIVPGSRGRTSAAKELIDLAERVTLERGWSIAHDHPYRGGHTTAIHGRPELHCHALQIEISRRRYMNEGSLDLVPSGWAEVRAFCRSLVASAGSLALG